MTKIIQVDKKDQFLDFIDKQKAHQDKGILHRAFSIVVVNDQGEILLQQRSKYKKLWPLYWSNTCCSHPTRDENITKQAEKRLKEEMGFSVALKKLFKFHYQVEYKDIGSENEMVSVFWGKHQGEKIKPDLKEVAGYKWTKYEDLLKTIKQNPKDFTPWFKKIVKDKKFAGIMQKLCGK